MKKCKPGSHKFYHKPIPPKTDPSIIGIIGCKKCDFEIYFSKELSKEDLAWARKVARKYERDSKLN